MTMDTISLRRRHLLIAGLIGVTAPVSAFAGRQGELREAAALPGLERVNLDRLVVSGRVAGALDGKPLAAAVIEAWPTGSNAERTVAMTDADGRFVLTTSAPAASHGGPRVLRYRVRYAGRELPAAQLHSGNAARWQRDDAGVWRTSLGLSVA